MAEADEMDSGWGDAPPPTTEAAPPITEAAPTVLAPAVATAPPLAATAPPADPMPTPVVEVLPPAPSPSKAVPEPVLPPPPALPKAAPTPAASLTRPSAPPPGSTAQARAPVAPVVARLRPPPTIDPLPITAADFEDERKPGPFASFGGPRPSAAWLVAGLVAVSAAFALGLLVGRSTAPVREPPAQASEAVPTQKTPETQAALAAVTSGAASTPTPSESSAAPAPAPEPAPSADSAKGAAPAKGLAPFNAKAAKAAIANAAYRIKTCKDASVPPGSASIVITFAPSGRVSDAAVTTPTYASGRIGSCIVSKLKSVQVPPFSGAPETVKKSVPIK